MPTAITVKSVLNKTKKRDSWFLDDYTINMYSGCTFNCLYCYIRGSKYGTHMEEKTSYKQNALEVLEKQLALRAKKKQHGFIVLSSATDPYLHFEKELQLTRQALQLIAQYQFPVHIITKSPLVTRDFDILNEIAERAILPIDFTNQFSPKVFVTFSFSTIDDEVGKIFEPGAPLPSERLAAFSLAIKNNFHSGISLMPLLPGITDTDEHLDKMFATFKTLGAKYILPATLTLFGNNTDDSKTLTLRAIEKHYPKLLRSYNIYFLNGNQMSITFKNNFYRKTNKLLALYDIPGKII